MTDTPWTPGPWTAEAEFVSDEYAIVPSVDGAWIDPYSEPNARLIAAAPEMAEILAAIIEECDDTGGEFWEGSNVATSDRMRALLSRIRGEARMRPTPPADGVKR